MFYSLSTMNIPDDLSLEDVRDTEVNDWLRKFEDKSLTSSDLRHFWCTWINKSFVLNLKEDRHYEPTLKKDIVNMLLETLEDFIFNKNKKQFNLENESSSVCGKIFEANEHFYTCCECSTDPTCVLCIKCFKKSAHRNHRYKFGISKGGGCCDCGDELSWKNDAYCEDHLKAIGQDSVDLPEDLICRYTFVIETVLQYCYELLSIDISSPSASIKRFTTAEDQDSGDRFCTVIYSNELKVHMFQSVSNRLTDLIKCSPAEALSITSYIEKRGRAIVYHDNYDVCKDFSDTIRYSKLLPFKVFTYHWSEIAHQTYSLQLLSWLQNLIKKSKIFRETFTSLCLSNNPKYISSVTGGEYSLIEGILLNLASLWKFAQLKWHNLIISCMLLDYECKKTFAKVFLGNYGAIAKKVFKDPDIREYSVFINSLSLQVFTIPSIAEYLIEHENALTIMFNVLLEFYNDIYTCTEKYCFKSAIPRTNIYAGCVSYVLQDLKYILGTQPSSLSPELSTNFIEGLSVFLKVLVLMQGMKAGRRQLIEETLHYYCKLIELPSQVKLGSFISKLLLWCSVNEDIFSKVYQLTILTMYENLSLDEDTEIELTGHRTKCYIYNVAARPISMNLPLSRFFSSLFLIAQKCSYNYNTIEYNTYIKESCEQLIEPVIRIQVMIAQAHAGLWGGYILPHFMEFYRAEREELLNKDIILLQIGASLIDNNKFLINMIHKFDILHWAAEDFETGVSILSEERIIQTIIVCEEFLSLIIAIIGERYNPAIGIVTKDDCLKHEILHRLFIKARSYSELNNYFPENIVDGTKLTNLINEVATFEKSKSASIKGKYVAKKEFRTTYNQFFYHYNKTEKSQSGEEQRRQRKLLDGIECCPPPQLCKLNTPFKSIATLLHCDVMLHIMSIVLKRSLNPKGKSFSENQFHMVLHLIGYALHEEECHEHGVQFTENAERWNIGSLLEKVCESKRVHYLKDLLTINLSKFRTLVNRRRSNYFEDTSSDVLLEMRDEITTKEAYTKAAAADKRAVIMTQMRSLQQSFYNNNSDVFKKLEIEGNALINEDLSENHRNTKVWTCILCQEDNSASNYKSVMVLGAYLQTSPTIPKNDGLLFHWAPKMNKDSNIFPVHIDTCGHTLHFDCWMKYAESKKKVSYLIETLNMSCGTCEYFCPLCKHLCNVGLPVIPQFPIIEHSESLTDWLGNIKEYYTNHQWHSGKEYDPNVEESCTEPKKTKHLKVEKKSFSVTYKDHVLICERNSPFVNHDPSMDVSNKLTETVASFASSVLKLYPMNEILERVDYLLVWQACAYTIRALDSLYTFVGKPLLGEFSSNEEICIENLVNLSTKLRVMNMNKLTESYYLYKTFILLFEPYQCEMANILKWESFELFYTLNMAMPSINAYEKYSQNTLFDKNLFRIILILNFAKIILFSDISKFISSDSSDTICEDTKCLARLVRLFKDVKGVDTIALWNHLKNNSVPFLNACTIFYYFSTQIEPCQSLKQVGRNTFENMINYIGLSSDCKDLLDCEIVTTLFTTWAQHPENKDFRSASLAVSNTVNCNLLINLPDDYCDLINMAADFTCSNSMRECRRQSPPSLCLKCGYLVCSEEFCCQRKYENSMVGSCTYHSIICGGGTGIFLRIRESRILLLSPYPRRGRYIPAPYFDNYGESDYNLVRGNPLHLCKEDYYKLQKIWMSHRIHQEISKVMEPSEFVMGPGVSFDWAYL